MNTKNEFYRKQLYMEKTDPLILKSQRLRAMGDDEGAEKVLANISDIVANIKAQYPDDEPEEQYNLIQDIIKE